MGLRIGSLLGPIDIAAEDEAERAGSIIRSDKTDLTLDCLPDGEYLAPDWADSKGWAPPDDPRAAWWVCMDGIGQFIVDRETAQRLRDMLDIFIERSFARKSAG